MTRRTNVLLSSLVIAACARTQIARDGVGPAASGTVWPDEGPRTWSPRATTEEISANDLRTRLYAFAHDSMKGRRIGEPGNEKGTDYIAREFARLGLRPAGENGTYFQTLPFGPAGFDGVASTFTVAGAALARGEWAPTVPSPLNGYASTVDLANVPAVFAGRLGDTGVVLDPERFRGKVAVFLPAATAAVSRPAMLRCDSVPDNFGAAAASALEAARRAAATAPAQAVPARDLRAQRAGAVAVLVAGLSPAAASAAFASRTTMQPVASPAGAPAGAAISDRAAEQIFGRPLGELTVGAEGAPIAA